MRCMKSDNQIDERIMESIKIKDKKVNREMGDKKAQVRAEGERLAMNEIGYPDKLPLGLMLLVQDLRYYTFLLMLIESRISLNSRSQT